ncbi:uncharacterized protein LOC132563388 [Ylistrum balloti]|uniref:uncharacterized protein LOC132563388 n=1 Tax=Ylistrum balloti TaxID=509963 RepID=UPI002905860B|nr:uncharacterized protein LOC132563388 [Ylistrum balloti]
MQSKFLQETRPRSKRGKDAVASAKECFYESFYKWVILSMVNDVFSVVTSDSLIMNFGKRLFDNKDIQEHTPNHINGRMRELGRLMLETRKLPSPIFSLEDCLNPLNFYTIVSCVKSLAGFNEDTYFYTTPSLALKVGYSLQRCAKILESNDITEKNQSKKENGENFLKLYSSNWNYLISSRARQTQEEKKCNAPKMLPLSQDVYMLTRLLKSKMRTMMQHLVDDISIYFELLKVTLCLVTLFNRKRGGDVQRITAATYKHALKMQNSFLFDNEVRSSLSTLERALSPSMTRIEIKGKQERKVSIILTKDMLSSINLLLEKKEEASVVGKYVFSRKSPSTRTYRARDVLREMCLKVNLKYADLITYTNLRKHIATMAQVHELSENEKDQLAKFLGHDIRIHREVYRQPLDLVQKTKITKMLLRVNEGLDIEKMTFNEEG